MARYGPPSGQEFDHLLSPPVPTKTSNNDTEGSLYEFTGDLHEDLRFPRPISRQQSSLKADSWESFPQPSKKHEAILEEKKQVASHRFSRAFTRSVVHVIPVLITTALITINARRVYYGDYGAPQSQNVVLQSFQFLVKGHEILIVASLTAIVLHRVRYDLLVAGGIPLGLLTSAYRLADLEYPISREFWSSSFNRDRYQWSYSRLNLVILILTSCLLTLLVGPSYGVLMIPKLSWWEVQTPFPDSSESIFVNATTSNLWPQTLVNYSCGGSWLCPGNGIGGLTTWASAIKWNDPQPKYSFNTAGSYFYRYVVCNSTNYDGWTAATSPGMKLSSDLAAFWNYMRYYNLKPVSIERPRIIPSFANGQEIMKPLVQVQCAAQAWSNDSALNLSFPNNRLRGKQAHIYDKVFWSVPDMLYKNGNQSMPDVEFAFVRIQNHSIAPTIGVLFFVTDDNATLNVVPCSVLAHWVPAHISIDPRVDLTIYDETSNPLDLFNSTLDFSSLKQIELSDSWLHQFNTHENNGKPNAVAGLVKSIGDVNVSSTDGRPDFWATHSNPQGLSWRLSTLLNMYVTDGIARFAADVSSFEYHDTKDPSQRAVYDYHLLERAPFQTPNGYDSFPAYAHSEGQMWQQLNFRVQRYGYGWSFDGVLIKLSVTPLVVHLLLAAGHVICLISGRWSSMAWHSVGDMMALALKSPATTRLANAGTGIKNWRTWVKEVAVYEGANGNLEMVLERETHLSRTTPEHLYA